MKARAAPLERLRLEDCGVREDLAFADRVVLADRSARDERCDPTPSGTISILLPDMSPGCPCTFPVSSAKATASSAAPFGLTTSTASHVAGSRRATERGPRARAVHRSSRRWSHEYFFVHAARNNNRLVVVERTRRARTAPYGASCGRRPRAPYRFCKPTARGNGIRRRVRVARGRTEQAWSGGSAERETSLFSARRSIPLGRHLFARSKRGCDRR